MFLRVSSASSGCLPGRSPPGNTPNVMRWVMFSAPVRPITPVSSARPPHGHAFLPPPGLAPHHLGGGADGGAPLALAVPPAGRRCHVFEDLPPPPVDGITALTHRRRLLVVRREEGEVLAHDLKALL